MSRATLPNLPRPYVKPASQPLAIALPPSGLVWDLFLPTYSREANEEMPTGRLSDFQIQITDQNTCGSGSGDSQDPRGPVVWSVIFKQR